MMQSGAISSEWRIDFFKTLKSLKFSEKINLSQANFERASKSFKELQRASFGSVLKLDPVG